MSQAITGLTSTTTTNVVSGTSNPTEAPTQGFGDALLTMLGSNTSSNENGATLSLLTLAGLVAGASNPEISSEEDSATSLLLDLGVKLDELEDTLAQDEQLLAVLQNWLQGVQSLLQQPQNAGQQAGDAQLTEGLSELANHPQTIRFAIQDAVVQLLSSSTNQQHSSLAKVNAQQIQAALQSLQQVLDQAQGDSKLLKANTLLDQATATSTQVDNSGKTMESVFKNMMNTSSDKDGASSQQDHESTTALQNGQVVTAGQLSLRHHVNAEVKALPTPVPVENFAKEVSGFVGKLDITKLQGVSEAKISLYPEHLGQVDIKITMQNGHMVAQFVTEHVFAKESLEGQMSQLRSALQAQGIQVNKLEVTQNSSLSSHMYHDENRGQNNNGSGQGQNSKRRDVREDDSIIINDLNDEWNEWVSEVKSRENGYGSSFVARV